MLVPMQAEDDDDYFWEDDDDFRVAPIIEPTGPGRSTTIIKPSQVTTKQHQAVAAATAAASKPSGVAGTRLGWDDSSDSGLNTIGSAGSEYAVEGQESEEEAFAGEDHMYISHASLQEP